MGCGGGTGSLPFQWFEGELVVLERADEQVDSGREAGGGEAGGAEGGVHSGDAAEAMVVYGTHAGSDTGAALYVGGGGCFTGAAIGDVDLDDGQRVTIVHTGGRSEIRGVVATHWSGEEISWYGEPWSGTTIRGEPAAIASPRADLVEVTPSGAVRVLDDRHLVWAGEHEWVFRGEVEGVLLEERLVQLGEDERAVRFEKQLPCCQGAPVVGGLWLIVLGVVRRRCGDTGRVRDAGRGYRPRP
ncbi:MAG: hypothetical protein H6742_19710 [Alphaproteobacteria bacterium]|nr:hypothetical protein [Alphaproteobacteria bacterium]